MRRKLFGISTFINQTKEQAFNLDTLLLNYFLKVPAKAKHILDVGTGSGVLMFYLKEKTKAKITGIEILENRYLQAKQNILDNEYKDQLEVLHQDFKMFEDKNIDLIVSNPPFFKMNEVKYLSQNEERLSARFEVHLTLEALIKKSSEVLKQGGYLTFVHRPERLDEILLLAAKYQFSVKRIQFVHPSSDKKANHLLIEMLKGGKTGGMIVEPPVIIYDENKTFTQTMYDVYKGEMPCY